MQGVIPPEIVEKFFEERIDIIGQNGNEGDHYMSIGKYEERQFLSNKCCNLKAVFADCRKLDYEENSMVSHLIINDGLGQIELLDLWSINEKPSEDYVQQVQTIHDVTGRLLKALDGEVV